MGKDPTSGSSTITSLTKKRDPADHPLMSYTAVTSHQSMAEAFLEELISLGQKIMPDHVLTITDVLSICKVALKQGGPGVVVLEGRHLRGRISEQLSRADRYKESFSVLVLQFDNADDGNVYDSMVDTLCERMRKTDLLFLFRSRIVLVLPHTEAHACIALQKRILSLVDDAMNPKPEIGFHALTYPNPDLSRSMKVLDWVEDRLRH